MFVWFYFVIFALTLFISWLATSIITPKFIIKAREVGFIGKDMNKLGRPEVAELGGIPVFLGFSLSICISLLLYFDLISVGLNFAEIMCLLVLIFLIFFLGLTDDILGWKKGIRQWQHFVVPMIFSTPLIVYLLISGRSELFIPFIGVISVGIIYPLIMVPIAVTATTNVTNLLAGFNGLEVGMGIIIFFTISIFAVVQGSISIVIILAAWIGGLLGIYRYNKYSAKIFVGDIVTLINGAIIGISAIMLKLELLIAFLIIIFIIEFVIKLKHSFATECFGVPQQDGTLKSSPAGGSLTHFVLGLGKFTEKKVVSIFLLMQVIVSIVTILIYFIVY